MNNHSQYRAVASLALNLRVTYRLYTGHCLICTRIFYTSLPIGLVMWISNTLLATPTLLLQFDFLGNLKRFTGVDDIYDDTWSCCFKVLEEGSCVTSIFVW